MKPEDVVAQHSAQQLAPPGADAEGFGVGRGDVPELCNHRLRTPLADQGGQAGRGAFGKVELKRMLDDLSRPPAGDASYRSDWGDPREYTLEDMGVGECAGEVVSPAEFALAAWGRARACGCFRCRTGRSSTSGRAQRGGAHGARAGDPKPHSIANLAEVQMRRKEFVAAAVTYARLAAMQPDDARWPAREGRALLFSNQPGAAAPVLRRALTMDPRNAGAPSATYS